jgi:hypothetical protein
MGRRSSTLVMVPKHEPAPPAERLRAEPTGGCRFQGDSQHRHPG